MKLIDKIKLDNRVLSVEGDNTIDGDDDNFNTHYGEYCIELKDGYEFSFGGGIAYERTLTGIKNLLTDIVKIGE